MVSQSGRGRSPAFNCGAFRAAPVGPKQGAGLRATAPRRILLTSDLPTVWRGGGGSGSGLWVVGGTSCHLYSALNLGSRGPRAQTRGRKSLERMPPDPGQVTFHLLASVPPPGNESNYTPPPSDTRAPKAFGTMTPRAVPEALKHRRVFISISSRKMFLSRPR